MQTVSIPPNAGRVQLRLALSAHEYESYSAVLSSSATKLNLPHTLGVRKEAGRDVLTIVVPARKLPYGEYQLRLSGRRRTGETQYVDTYSFRVKID